MLSVHNRIEIHLIHALRTVSSSPESWPTKLQTRPSPDLTLYSPPAPPACPTAVPPPTPQPPSPVPRSLPLTRAAAAAAAVPVVPHRVPAVSAPSATSFHWVLRGTSLLPSGDSLNPSDLRDFRARPCPPGAPSRSRPCWFHLLRRAVDWSWFRFFSQARVAIWEWWAKARPRSWTSGREQKVCDHPLPLQLQGLCSPRTRTQTLLGLLFCCGWS
jgi:hypothetical protein